MKQIIQKMKEDIKAMASYQKLLKENRKTVNFQGQRIMPSYEAQYKVPQQRYKLHTMYIAYLMLRGKDYTKAYPNLDSYDIERAEFLVKEYTENVKEAA